MHLRRTSNRNNIRTPSNVLRLESLPRTITTSTISIQKVSSFYSKKHSLNKIASIKACFIASKRKSKPSRSTGRLTKIIKSCSSKLNKTRPLEFTKKKAQSNPTLEGIKVHKKGSKRQYTLWKK